MKEQNTLTHRETQPVLVSVFPYQEKNTLTHIRAVIYEECLWGDS